MRNIHTSNKLFREFLETDTTRICLIIPKKPIKRLPDIKIKLSRYHRSSHLLEKNLKNRKQKHLSASEKLISLNILKIILDCENNLSIRSKNSAPYEGSKKALCSAATPFWPSP